MFCGSSSRLVNSPVASTAVRSKSVVLLLLIHCLFLLPLFVGVLSFWFLFVMQYLMSFLVCNHLDEEEMACCSTLIVFPMSSDY